ncbi:hypothetical protein EI94DRAFT_1706777 [Lactarius quietus]|nr:hypothetical protein EI94DRAFT_1706777 [Lactarius quietus]
MASELMQVELQFLAIAAKLFAAAMIFSAHPPDDGQQIYLDRKVKDEITSLETQFNAFMEEARIHPIIQIMVQEWKAAEAEQRMPNWGIFTLDYISEHCNAQREAHTDWHLHLSTVDFTLYLQGIPDDRHWWITGLPAPQSDPESASSFLDDDLIGAGLSFALLRMIRRLRQSTERVVASFLQMMGKQAYLVRKVKDEIISVGNQFKKFMGDPSKHTKKPRMHPIIQIMSEGGRRLRQSNACLTGASSLWITYLGIAMHSGRPTLTGTLIYRRLISAVISRAFRITGDVAMEVMAAPAQPSAPISAAAPTMPDAPATSKAKAHTLPPAGSSDPYGAPPASTTRRAPYAFRRPRRQPGAEPMQGTFSTTPSDDFEDCTLSDMIADMDSTPSAQGRASDMSLPRVQVDDASPPPPAQRRRLDIQPLVATGDYRCGTCKNPKVNNAQCVSQLNENRLTYKCAFCAEKRRLCAPVASWAQPIIRLMKFRNIDVPPDVEASYGPSAVGTSSISPGENLESRVNSLEAKMDYVILVLNALAGIQGIVPSDLPGYTQPPAPRRSASPSHHSLSSLELPLHP